MTLTYEQRFFEKAGFTVVNKGFAAVEGLERLREVSEAGGVRRDRDGSDVARGCGD